MACRHDWRTAEVIVWLDADEIRHDDACGYRATAGLLSGRAETQFAWYSDRFAQFCQHAWWARPRCRLRGICP